MICQAKHQIESDATQPLFASKVYQPTLSFVVPALNEEGSIELTVAQILIAAEGRLSNYEIILINDGSIDATGSVMERLAAENDQIRVIHNKRNLGIGGAYKRGVAQAKYEYVMMVPGDNAHPASGLTPILDEVGKADIVVPYVINPSARTVLRRLISRTHTALINLFFGLNVRYYNGLVVHRTASLRQISIMTNGFDYQMEALVKLLKQGHSAIEVGTLIEERQQGDSTAVRVKSVVGVLKTVLRLQSKVSKSPISTSTPEVPYVNIAGQHAAIKAELLEAVSGVLDRGNFVLGEEVQEFEQRFAELCGVRFAVGVNSGTDAAILALRALGIGPGDEVITVPNSFIASTSCIMMVGAQPIFVDVRDDYNLDPTQLEQAITDRTKAILPVHLTGRPADMAPILEIAQKYGLHVVEDCAQAVLAEYRGQRVGSFGAAGCFSLHPLKTLNACGDGGVVTTNDETLYEELKILRNIGLKTRDNCVAWSSNSRLDTLQAALLLVKLRYLRSWTEKRRANAAYYQQALAGIPGLKVPIEREYERSVYHTFVVQAEQRDELKQYLASNGIQTSIHYPVPIHLHTAAADLGYGPGSFPVTEQQAKQILSLPIYPELREADLASVVQRIREFYSA